MLEQIKIQNFQSHAKLAIDFGPGITTIVGPSDVGKSAVLRALWWVAANHPSGEAFVRHGARGATVRVVVDGHTIARRRGVEVNTYELDGTELKAFGSGVPDVVAEVFNLGPDNFQGQHDAPYWFSETAGQVSRNLNAIIDLGIIDDALGAMVGRLNHARTGADVALERLGTSKARREETAWAAKADADYDNLEDLGSTAHRARVRHETLRVVIGHAQSYEALRERATDANLAARNLLKLCQKAGKARKAANTLETTITRIEELEAVPPAPDFTPVKESRDRWRTAVDTRDTLATLLDTLQTLTKRAATAKENAEAAHTEFHEQTKGACPLCGRTD